MKFHNHHYGSLVSLKGKNIVPGYERLNGVNRQSSNGKKFNRQPSKKKKIYRQPSKKQSLSAVKWFEGLSNLSISAAHLGLRTLKESF